MIKEQDYKKRFFQIGAFLIFAILINYCYLQENSDVIAKVGSFKIRQVWFEEELKRRAGSYASKVDKKLFLQGLIEERLLLEKAHHMGLDQKEEIRREYDAILMAKVRGDFIEKPLGQIQLGDKDFEKYYQEHQKDFATPQKSSFAILFYKKQKKTDTDFKNRILEKFQEIRDLQAKNLLPEAKDGFGKYAMDHSEHQVSRYQGGKIGWFYKNETNLWEQKVLDAGFLLKNPGDLSEMIETEKGYYLIRLVEILPQSYQSLSSVKGKIHYALIQNRQEEVQKKFMQSLREEIPVFIEESKLDEIKLFDQNEIQGAGEPSIPQGHWGGNP